MQRAHKLLSALHVFTAYTITPSQGIHSAWQSIKSVLTIVQAALWLGESYSTMHVEFLSAVYVILDCLLHEKILTRRVLTHTTEYALAYRNGANHASLSAAIATAD
jgi:hypothetical protein